ncbi:MAG: iron ABC transporter permease [Oscillospiraceae bacterium]|jgi:iron complex transport system permease protein|nr:iron ABC transporter permease [Oscillospiraceae bacterium]
MNERQISAKRYALVVILLTLLLVAAVFVSFGIGRYKITPATLLEAVWAKFAEKVNPLLTKLFHLRIVAPEVNVSVNAIVWNSRFPRVIMACLVGCCLSGAGASYQGVFQNPMASPDILGASSGAGMGASLAILLQLGAKMTMVFAFVASIGAIALVMLVSRAARGSRVLRIILAGIMVSSLCNAVTSFIKLIADPNNILPAITFWMMGSLAKTRASSLGFTMLPMAAGIIPLILIRWRINLLTLSDDEAKTMGVNVPRVRLTVIVCATLVTAAAVSVSGLIGWVGLVVPHLCRKLVGSNYKRLLPVSLIGGAVFMLLVDDVSRNLLRTEIPIGILTAVIGAPFFLWLITRKSEVV